ncbi:MAG: S9 family peptidase [Chloroflexi bacterium]|nr:S9 family peptidase [Chloroflexota bacterium]
MSKRIQPDYHYYLKTAANPAISPSGLLVAFTVHQFDRKTHEATTDLFVARTDGSGEPVQYSDSGDVSRPAWSPAGDRLAYLDHDDSGVRQIFVVPAEGPPESAMDREPSEEEKSRPEAIRKQLTHQVADVDAFAWSPEGEKIAFRGLVPGPDELDAIASDSAEPKIRVARRIRYRQDGVGWRGDSFYHLFVLDLSSGAVSQITEGEGDDGPPVWSPEGQHIAFITDRNDERELTSHTELYVCGVDGSSSRQWSDDLFMVESIAWSPDSHRIAVTGGRDRSEVGGYGLTTQSSVYVLGPGSSAAKLTDDSIRPLSNGSGLPVGGNSPTMLWTDKGIVLGADSRGQSHVCIVDPGSKSELRKISGGWQINEMAGRSDSGFVVVAATSPTSFGELYRVDLNSGDVNSITRLNARFFDDHSVASLEKFSFTRDHFEIETRVWFPPDFDPTNKYPLLLDVHGGPHSAFYDAFYPIHQVATGAGYVVVAPNPRGSSTYGLDFATAVHGDWGGGDFEDVMEAMEIVASRDYIDERKVVIHGSSYGGFMSSWAVGHTDRFNAAVIAAPVTYLPSFYGTSDIGVNFTETQLNGERFEAIEHYREHSPLTYARNVNTPVLLIHGEDDARVPIEQSEQYFVALKRHGKKVEFVRLPGTSHGIFRAKHPLIRQQYFSRMIDWMNRHND